MPACEKEMKFMLSTLCSHLLAFGVLAASPEVLFMPVISMGGAVEGSDLEEMNTTLPGELGRHLGKEVKRGEWPKETPQRSGRHVKKPATSSKDFRRAKAQLAEGRKLFRKLRIAGAIKALKRGIEGLERNLSQVEEHRVLLDGYRMLSVAYFRRGNANMGTSVLESLLRLDPTIELDSRAYPPIFLTILEKARQRQRRRPLGSLKFQLSGAPATVKVNGKVLGVTPLLVDGLFPGENHVQVSRSGERWGKIIRVEGGRVKKVRARLKTASRSTSLRPSVVLSANRFGPYVRREIMRLAKQSRAKYAVVMGMAQDDGIYRTGGFLGQISTGGWVALEPLAPDLDMLSVGVEAHTFAANVASHLASFEAQKVDEDAALLAGYPQGDKPEHLDESPIQEAQETRVAFFEPLERGRGPIAQAPAKAGRQQGRGPVISGLSTRSPVSAAHSHQEAASTETSSSRRGPVTSRSPVASPGSSRRPVMGVDPANTIDSTLNDNLAREEPPLEPIKPTLGDAHEVPILRGPVVNSSQDLNALTEKSTAAIARAGIRHDTLSGENSLMPDLAIEAGIEQVPLVEKWWFWTALATGAALVAGGTTALILSQSTPSSVRVVAVW
jgi:hypothetical protein